MSLQTSAEHSQMAAQLLREADRRAGFLLNTGGLARDTVRDASAAVLALSTLAELHMKMAAGRLRIGEEDEGL